MVRNIEIHVSMILMVRFFTVIDNGKFEITPILYRVPQSEKFVAIVKTETFNDLLFQTPLSSVIEQISQHATVNHPGLRNGIGCPGPAGAPKDSSPCSCGNLSCESSGRPFPGPLLAIFFVVGLIEVALTAIPFCCCITIGVSGFSFSISGAGVIAELPGAISVFKEPS